MKTKFNKESRNLLIGLLVGDGTVSNNKVFKISHGYKQKEYIEWKIKLLNAHGIKNNGLKSYEQKQGYAVGTTVYYTQLAIVPFIHLLRRIIYKPKKTIANRKILNRLGTLGLAIWYMDDGHLNTQKNKAGEIRSFAIKISTCLLREENQVLIDFLREEWGLSFYQFKEGRPGKDTYSIACGAQQGRKFIELIKSHVESCPSMLYKIKYDLERHENVVVDSSESKSSAPEMGEDIVWTLEKSKEVISNDITVT